MLKLTFTALTAVQGVLFSHNNPQNTFVGWDSSFQQNQQVSLGFYLSLFGTGSVNELYVSSYGAVSYSSLAQDVKVGDFDDNIVLAPFWVPSISGQCQHEVFTSSDSSFFNDAESDISSYIGESFSATDGFLVTWTDVVSEADSADKATFQAFFLTDGVNSFVVYNYDKIDFTQALDLEPAEAGIFVSADNTDRCWRRVNDTSSSDLDRDALTSTTNCGNPGHWVMRLDDILKCTSDFQTACGDKDVDGTWTTQQGYFVHDANWDFFSRYTCVGEGLEIQPNVTHKDSYCVYDSDYYDSRWSCEQAPECVDYSVASEYEVSVTVSTNSTSDDNRSSSQVIEQAIDLTIETFQDKLCAEMGTFCRVEDVLLDSCVPSGDNDCKSLNLDKVSEEQQSDFDSGEQFTLTLTMLSPNPASLTEDDIADAILDEWNDELESGFYVFVVQVEVKDKTRACLKQCLGCNKPGGCGGTPPPIQYNLCCGTCSNSADFQGGRAYSSLQSACCQDKFIYDPDTHVCCNVGTDANPFFKKVSGQYCN